jgi:hypothetical protein
MGEESYVLRLADVSVGEEVYFGLWNIGCECLILE